MNNDEERIRKNFENIEFNNSLEDLTVMSEEKKNNNKRNIIIICILIFIIFIALLLLLFNKKDNSKSEDNTSSSDNTSQDAKTGANTDIDIYKDKGKVLFFNKYIYDSSSRSITYDDNEIRLDSGYLLKEGKNALYEVNINKGSVKYFTGSSFKDVINTIGEYIYVKSSDEKFLGLYDTKSKKIYLLKDDSYSTSSLNSYAYIVNNTIYMDDNYVIVKNDNKYGVYDISIDKLIIDMKYDFLKYLGGKRFVSVLKNKANVLDEKGRELTNIEYDFIEKKGGYYLAYNNGLRVLDKNLKDIGVNIKVNNIDNYSYFDSKNNPFESYMFNNYLIVRANEKYYYLKNNSIESLDIGYTSSGVSIYDKDMNKINDIEVEDFRHISSNIFLNTILVLDYDKYYNINTKEKLKSINTFRRVYKEYEVVFDKNSKILTISKDNEVLGKIENASFKGYIESSNNGIINNKDEIIYNDNLGSILIIKKNHE